MKYVKIWIIYIIVIYMKSPNIWKSKKLAAAVLKIKVYRVLENNFRRYLLQ